MPDNHRQLHWAQAKIYGYLMCEECDLENIKIALVYYINNSLYINKTYKDTSYSRINNI